MIRRVIFSQRVKACLISHLSPIADTTNMLSKHSLTWLRLTAQIKCLPPLGSLSLGLKASESRLEAVAKSPVPAVPSTFDMIERSQADKTDDRMHWTGGPSRSQKKKESNSTAQVREKRNRKKSKAKQWSKLSLQIEGRSLILGRNVVQLGDFMFCFLFDFHFVLSISAYYFATERRNGEGYTLYGWVPFGSGYKMILRTSVCVCFPWFSRNKNTLATTSNTLISFKNKIDEIIAVPHRPLPSRSENRIWWMTMEEVVASRACWALGKLSIWYFEFLWISRVSCCVISCIYIKAFCGFPGIYAEFIFLSSS